MKNTDNLSHEFTTAAERNFDNWFNGSVVVDTNGHPLVVYHSSDADFNVKEIAPLSHFGSYKAAEERSTRNLGNYKVLQGDTQFYPVFLSIKKPLYMPDIAQHIREFYAEYFKEKDSTIFTNLECDEVFKDDKGWKKNFADALEKKGFDGIIYKNEFEDKGSLSFIPLKNNQICSAMHIDQKKISVSHFLSHGVENLS